MTKFRKTLKNHRNFKVFWEAWEALARPRRSQDGPSWRLDGPGRRQDVSKKVQDSSKTLRNRFKMHPRPPQIRKCRNLEKTLKNLRNFKVFWEAWEALVRPRRSQDGRSWRQDRPGRRQEVSKKVQDSSKTLRNRFKMHPRLPQI